MSPTPSTGPRTDEGKSISSKNSTATGLYTAADYILPDEQSFYNDLQTSVLTELAPEGMLEHRLAEEILGAMWRLRRCRKLEGDTAAVQPQDPMQPESAQAKRQQSIDRARNQATRLLHKNTAELRRLQTERLYRHEICADGIQTAGLGVSDVHTAFTNADRTVKSMQRRPLSQLKLKLETMALESKLRYAEAREGVLANPEGVSPVNPAEPVSPNEGGVRFVNSHVAETRQPPEIARGALCPCNSGKKYKRCCGKTAPPLLHHVAPAA